MIVAAAAFGFVSARVTEGPVALVVGGPAILVMLLLVWWIRGRRGWRIDEETTVAAPPEAVFALLGDPNRTPAIDPRVVRVEPLEGGRLRVFARVRRRDVEAELVEVAREPPALLVQDVVEVRVGGKLVAQGSQRQTFTLETANGGTRVRLRITGRADRAASRIALGVVHGDEARAARAMLRRLRDSARAP